MRFKYSLLLVLLPLLTIATANAAVTVGATRLIYNGASSEANLTVSNRDDSAPYLVQSWVSPFGSTQEKSLDSFIVTPPLFRLDANKENILRVIFAGDASIPNDQESLFLMNVKAIPAMSDEQRGKNVLQIALKTTIKLFYRPAGLKGSLAESVKNLHWNRTDGALTVRNTAPFHIVISALMLNGKPLDHVQDVLRPGEQLSVPAPVKAGDEVSLSYIDDYGSSVIAPVVHLP